MLTGTSQQSQQAQQRGVSTPPPSGPVPVAPIPTQTFTNQNFVSVSTASVAQQVRYVEIYFKTLINYFCLAVACMLVIILLHIFTHRLRFSGAQKVTYLKSLQVN
jgi:hypothetical protein